MFSGSSVFFDCLPQSTITLAALDNKNNEIVTTGGRSQRNMPLTVMRILRIWDDLNLAIAGVIGKWPSPLTFQKSNLLLYRFALSFEPDTGKPEVRFKAHSLTKSVTCSEQGIYTGCRSVSGAG
jgi:hypothetical protein